MAYRLPSLNALRVFEAAARHMSFKRAAEELAVTPTAVSHQIRGLEDYFEVELFKRLTRALVLTAHGEALLPKIREGLECFAAAVENVRPLLGVERLDVVAPPTFATRWLVPRLRGFKPDKLEIDLHVSASLGTIDLLPESTARQERIDSNTVASDVEIRFGHGEYPGMQVDRILTPKFVAVCHPSLLMGKRPLRTPADLRFHELIHDDTVAPGPNRPCWQEWCRLAGVSGIDTESGAHFGEAGLAISAAADGLGLAIAAEPLVTADIAAGRLASPFDVRIETPYAYHLVAKPDVAERPGVTAFRNWLLAEAAKPSLRLRKSQAAKQSK